MLLQRLNGRFLKKIVENNKEEPCNLSIQISSDQTNQPDIVITDKNKKSLVIDIKRHDRQEEEIWKVREILRVKEELEKISKAKAKIILVINGTSGILISKLKKRFQQIPGRTPEVQKNALRTAKVLCTSFPRLLMEEPRVIMTTHRG